ncbi:hypothetical protein PROFUN_13593, partial [Planoprotostelium fungivorum]
VHSQFESLGDKFGIIGLHICEKGFQESHPGKLYKEICPRLQQAIEETFSETGGEMKPLFGSQTESESDIEKRALSTKWKPSMERMLEDATKRIAKDPSKGTSVEELKKLINRKFFEWFTAILQNKQPKVVPESTSHSYKVKKLFPPGAFDEIERKQRMQGQYF